MQESIGQKSHKFNKSKQSSLIYIPIIFFRVNQNREYIQ